MELTGHTTQNTFDIYHTANSGNLLRIHDGANSAFDHRTIIFAQNGGNQEAIISPSGCSND